MGPAADEPRLVCGKSEPVGRSDRPRYREPRKDSQPPLVAAEARPKERDKAQGGDYRRIEGAVAATHNFEDAKPSARGQAPSLNNRAALANPFDDFPCSVAAFARLFG